MKHLHKFASVLLALVMAFSLMAPAFATGTGDGTDDETEKKTANIIVPILEGHTFTAYQIFTGTQKASTDDNAPLADIEWGTGINSTTFLAALKSSNDFGENNPFENVVSATDVANVLSGQDFNSEMAITFARIATDHIQGDGSKDQTGTGKITGLDQGYYLIVDETVLTGTDTVRNASLLQLTKDVEITVKVDVPQVDKQVQEDSDEAYKEGADYDIGEDVPFKFVSAVPNMTQYDTYKYIFHDKMDDGLTFNNDVKVKIGNTEVAASNYSVVVKSEGSTDITDDCSFEIRFTDLKSVVANMDKKAGDVIEVTFTAKLNENAQIGSAGNKNEVKLEYSNNPSDFGDGETGETPTDTVIVFTYELNPDKTNSAGEKLDGAKFHLAKVVDGKRVWATVAADGKISWAEASEGTTNVIEDAVTGKDAQDKDIVEDLPYGGTEFSSENGTFAIHGLDADEYELWEVQAPAGYNTPKTAFKVVIESTIDQDKEELTNLTVTLDGVATKTDKESNEPGNFAQSGKLPVTILNQSGTTLPETGGIGTTIFYVVGGLLTVGAVVLLVTKKRMSADSDK